LLALLVIWTIIWKGWALWRAARNKELAWYIVILLLNTLGILEIIYIFGFSGYGKDKK
jgi:methionyl-tRNA synthetase